MVGGDLDAEGEALFREAERHLRRRDLHHVEDARIDPAEGKEERDAMLRRGNGMRGVEHDPVLAELLAKLSSELEAKLDEFTLLFFHRFSNLLECGENHGRERMIADSEEIAEELREKLEPTVFALAHQLTECGAPIGSEHGGPNLKGAFELRKAFLDDPSA